MLLGTLSQPKFRNGDSKFFVDARLLLDFFLAKPLILSVDLDLVFIQQSLRTEIN